MAGLGRIEGSEAARWWESSVRVQLDQVCRVRCGGSGVVVNSSSLKWPGYYANNLQARWM